MPRAERHAFSAWGRAAVSRPPRNSELPKSLFFDVKNSSYLIDYNYKLERETRLELALHRLDCAWEFSRAAPSMH